MEKIKKFNLYTGLYDLDNQTNKINELRKITKSVDKPLLCNSIHAVHYNSVWRKVTNYLYGSPYIIQPLKCVTSSSPYKLNEILKNYEKIFNKSLSSSFDIEHDIIKIFHYINLELLITKKDRILVLQNPDLFLSGDQINILYDIMIEYQKTNNLKIIIISNNESILNYLRINVIKKKINLNDILIVHKTNNLEEIEVKMDEDGGINNWPKGFFDDIDKEFDIIFYDNDKKT